MGVDLVDDTEQMVLNMGPEHPSTHGLLRLVVHLDGEVVIKVEPKLGYLHRGFEKIAESHTYPQFIPFTDRLDYLSAPANNLGYTQAVEKLAGIEVPERAEYLRVIFAELARIASHMVMIGSTALDMAGVTPWAYCFRDRERILDLFEMTTGSRLTVNLLRIGGISKEPPPEFWLALQSFLDDLPKVVEEYQGIFFGNEIAMARLKSVGIFSREWVKKYGLTGPISRASGISFDVRKAEPYGIYDRFDFQIPVRYGCDSYDRTLIRLDEMVESAKIIRQAVRDIPEGAVLAKVPKVLKPPVGEVYHRVENPKGEMGFYVVSDGTNKPARVHIRSASFINLQILPVAAVGCKIQDLILIFSSLDPVAGEVDK